MLKHNLLSAFDGVFTRGQLIDIITMSKLCAINHVDLHTTLSSTPPIPKAGVRTQKQILPARKCPECGEIMRLYPVNSDPDGRDRVGSTDLEDKSGLEYKSMWLCGSMCAKIGCLHEEYNTYSVRDYMSDPGLHVKETRLSWPG